MSLKNWDKIQPIYMKTKMYPDFVKFATAFFHLFSKKWKIWQVAIKHGAYGGHERAQPTFFSRDISMIYEILIRRDINLAINM